MWFEILLVFILFKFKNCPNISGIRVVDRYLFILEGAQIYLWPWTSQPKGQFFEIEIYISSESWINKLSIDVWFVKPRSHQAR